MTQATLDVHLEPAPDSGLPEVVLLLAVDGFDGPFRVHLSPAEAAKLARTVDELLARRARIARAGEN